MKLASLFVAAQALLLTRETYAQSNATNSSSIIAIDSDPVGDLNAAAWAIIYTYPLAIFANWIGGVFQHVGINQIFHQRTLATPADPGVIKPNVDTLYSRVVLDLSSQDVVLTIPVFNDGRYFNYPVYDPFGNNIAEIGIVNGNTAGQYLIRRSDDQFTAPGYVSYNDSAITGLSSIQNVAQYLGVVNVPTTYATMLIRIELLHNTTADLNAVHTYQNASSLTPLPRSNATNLAAPAFAPSLNSTAPAGGFLGIDNPNKQLSFAARLVPYIQPEVYSERYRVATILARAGLYSGSYHPVSNVNLTQAQIIANNSITADINTPSNVRRQGNNWFLSVPSYQGNFGTHYASAAYVALAGYQQQRVQQTLYPGYGSLGFTSVFNLPANGSFIYTFSAKPRVASYGFWSLTVYGPDQYLIPNALNRFEVGDRNYDIQYRDGSGPVYGPNANASHDGPFEILVQRANQTPPANWTGNWLPAAGTFSQLLRWYVPEPAMTNGSYIYPQLRNISAILA